MDIVQHWIAGGRVPGRSGRTVAVTDPADGQVVAEVPLACIDEVDAAVRAARAASGSWAETSLARRSRILFAFRDLIDRRREDLAALIVREHGKVRSDALGEVQRGLEVVEFMCGLPHLLAADHSINVSTGVDSHALRRPVGVCVGITPFNFPVMVPMWMHPVAIACGNTFVLKPSEKNPSASMLTAELWAEAGLPDGVFNVLHGDAVAVDALLQHPGVDAISFVGSTPIAQHVYTVGSTTGKRVQALGGAKNHMVVLPDTDLELAIDSAIGAGYGSAGERCMAISVVVAVGDVADPLVDGIRQRLDTFVIGPGMAADSEMGPLVTAEHRDRVAGYVDAGVADGALLVADGRGLRIPGREAGFWLGPTLFDHVTPDMRIYTDEIFGPVLCVVRVPDLDAAIELINSNPYGNGTAVFTRDGRAARKFELEVEVGMVGINVPIPVPMAYHSFGGWKQSLYGASSMHGEHGVHFYTRTKTVTTRWPESGRARGAELSFPQVH